ncbi:hypothetical protein MG5_02324 [Candida albicans P57072]|uniref:Rrp15p n=3 Tax=Candida albicans TaxID=5476 RepID=A0A1D8PIJ2_CANAL|nr:Rrp15p [Candida albicans SC5314]KAF6063886.1 Rrp15p family protein [Candida albicans]KGQ89459.1 hypothetical protein MEO_02325 [Candida albicans P94015]KGQ95925.1 hypothetical protein MEU_02327 [Candida albicans P37005]KGR00524.1 hypothetical protein MG1_02352 [Candida albicans GC75]KGR11776.1 hypothetical protein MG5_02324 [Candida albicans P57072]KGR13909.1 hypothetical protein MG3_02343 [Candida albicans P78048]KGR20747.1 hypothetical protein MG9_02339 [Candida albicans P37037]KGT7031|eukprot:XP_710002.1 Rrp15p [Candida albicans SC5314]
MVSVNKSKKSTSIKQTNPNTEKKKTAKVVIEEEEQDQSNSSSQEVESEDESDSELEVADNDDLDQEIGSDDEVNIADASSSEGSDASEDENENEEEDFPKLKKRKTKSTEDGSESFADALNSIVNSKLKAYDRKDPILARNKVTLKKLESDKLEMKAKRALLQEKKVLHDNARVKNLLPTSNEPEKVRQVIEKEKALKKVAQRGVVRLFNAVLSTQIKTNQEVNKEKLGQTKKEEIMNEVSKNKFLDLIAAAGNE